MKEIKTQELNITAYQRNAIAVDTLSHICRVILNTGIEVHIVCPDDRKAVDVKNTILYYPTENENPAFDFTFDLVIKIID